MVSPIIGTSAANAQAFCRRTSAAARLGAAERTGLAVQALAGSEPIARLADRHDVSRKFVYQQKAKATETLEQAFAGILDERFAEVAERLKVPLPRVHAVCEWLGTDPDTPAYRRCLLGSVAVLPEPPQVPAERMSPACRQESRRTADRPTAPALAGVPGPPAVPPELTWAAPAVSVLHARRRPDPARHPSAKCHPSKAPLNQALFFGSGAIPREPWMVSWNFTCSRAKKVRPGVSCAVICPVSGKGACVL